MRILNLRYCVPGADNCYKFMRIGLRILELAFGVIKAKGWKEIFTPFLLPAY